MAEFRVGNLLFTANFDSGNLARVEKVVRPGDDEENGKEMAVADVMKLLLFDTLTYLSCK